MSLARVLGQILLAVVIVQVIIWTVYTYTHSLFLAGILIMPLSMLVWGYLARRMLYGLNSREARRLRLIFDADMQHAAYLDGDTDLGTYGKYPPERFDR